MTRIAFAWLLPVLLTMASGCGRTAPTVASFPVTSEPDPLRGTRWQLVAFQSREAVPSLPDEPDLFVTFSEGVMRVRGGCNTSTALYVLDGQRFTVTTVTQTLKDCPDLVVDQLERSLASALSQCRSYTIDRDELRIRFEGGELLLRRAPNG
ncbi:MAG: META domain-containing protein [Anaerolineae bacterium]